ncbi:phage tail protein [Lactobacillus kefiranofaciens]|uniref:phage tail protein n=1 Tax=Lactobacillus kefiranofaciens TaxID=267818 RepID=UPI0024699E2A|nr:phage tail protein [Lactobacillus kefiranofaciens]MDH5099751.1 phage tail protein [Lactobacillus kefiranofaciens]
MEITGLNDIIVWRYDNTGKVITDPSAGGFTYDGDKGKVHTVKDKTEVKGLFKIDLASSYGATQANITGLAPSVNRVYGSNFVAEVNTGAEQPSIALAANDIPHNVYDLLTGLAKDQLGGYTRKGKATPTLGGVIAHSYNTHKGTDLYFAFPMGTFVPGELNMGTNTENPNAVHDALTLNAQARSTDLLLYEKFYSDEVGFDFDKMISYVTGASATQGLGK